MWVTVDLPRVPVTPIIGICETRAKIAALIQLVDEGKVNFSIASTKILMALLISPQKDPLQIATELNLLQESDNGSVEAWVDAVIEKMPDKVKEYKTGKKAGENRVLWTGAKVFPFGSSVASFLNKTETEEGFRK